MNRDGLRVYFPKTEGVFCKREGNGAGDRSGWPRGGSGLAGPWPARWTEGQGRGPPVHGGPGRGRRGRRHGRFGRAHHGGSRGLGEPRKAHGRAVREQANSRCSVAAAGHGRDAQATRWHGSVPAAKLRRARSRSREGERGRERHRRDPHLAAKLGQVFSLSRTRRLVRSTVARRST